MFRPRDFNIFAGILLAAILFTKYTLSTRPELDSMARSVNFLIVITIILVLGINGYLYWKKNQHK
jgi:hypothetical protein